MNDHKPINLTDSNFDSEVKRSSIPVLVDFWAEWCPPCRAFGPTVEALAAEYGGRAKVGKVDVDANPHLSHEFAIQSIPTTLLIVDGQVAKRFVGVVSKEDLSEAIDDALPSVAA